MLKKEKKKVNYAKTMQQKKDKNTDFGFGLGTKSGRMIKARGGGSVKTKLNGTLQN